MTKLQLHIKAHSYGWLNHCPRKPTGLKVYGPPSVSQQHRNLRSIVPPTKARRHQQPTFPCNIEALIIRIGFGVYYTIVIIRSPQNPYSNYYIRPLHVGQDTLTRKSSGHWPTSSQSLQPRASCSISRLLSRRTHKGALTESCC